MTSSQFVFPDECGFEGGSGQPFRVAEFGANEGGTSMAIMTEIIGKFSHLKTQSCHDDN